MEASSGALAAAAVAGAALASGCAALRPHCRGLAEGQECGSSAGGEGEQRGAGLISERGVRISGPLTSYSAMFFKAMPDLWDPEANPEGYFIFAAAENKLGYAHVKPLFDEAAKDFPHELAAYGAPDGIQRLKDALAAHMSRNFGGFEFSPQHMICAAGCTPLLDMFAFCTCDDGDGIMLPTPYYPGFAIEVCYKTGAKLLPLHTAAPDFRVTAAGLRECYDNATKAGTRVRGLLLTNPTNPLGTTMNREELGAAIDFVREVGIHLLADEVYAQSVYGTAEGAEEFVSVSTLCKARGEPLGDQLHVM